MALQERVTTLGKRIAEVVELQAKNERGMDRIETNMDRLEAQAAADREQAKADLEEFREALRRDTEAFRIRAEASNEAFREASRLDNEAFRASMNAIADKFAADLRADTASFKAEMRRDRGKLAKEMGKLANRFGTVAEDIVAPNIPSVARRHFGIRAFEHFAIGERSGSASDPAAEREFDVVAWDSAHFIVTEFKSHPTIRDADIFLSRLTDLVDFYPQAAVRRIVPIFASFRIHDGIETYLTRHGVYCMAMRGDTMRLSNFDEVQAARGQS